jgi:hypothetical protein
VRVRFPPWVQDGTKDHQDSLSLFYFHPIPYSQDQNYLFAESDEGAKRTAMFYSLTGTCKLHGVDPMAWMKTVLERIADHKINKLHELFPQNLTLPEKSSQ